MGNPKTWTRPPTPEQTICNACGKKTFQSFVKKDGQFVAVRCNACGHERKILPFS